MKNVLSLFASLVLIFALIQIVAQNPIATSGSFFTETPLEDPLEYEVDSEWIAEGTLSEDMNSDGDILFPDRNSEGTWLSPLLEIDLGEHSVFRYSADMRDGNGEVRFRLWNDTAVGEPDRIETLELRRGDFEEEYDFSDYSFMEIEIFMEETSNNENERPHVDSISFVQTDFDVIESEFMNRWFIMLFLLFAMAYVYFFARM